jgi:hypothetical protein
MQPTEEELQEAIEKAKEIFNYIITIRRNQKLLDLRSK